MLIIAFIKNRGTKILPQNCCPVALLFKDGGGLANHPLSCHQQGVFGNPESKKKKKENGRKGKQREKLPPIILLLPKKLTLQTVHRAYIMPMIRKFTKTSKLQLLHQGYFKKKKSKIGSNGESNVKWDKSWRVGDVNSGKMVNSVMRHEQWQVGSKFRNL